MTETPDFGSLDPDDPYGYGSRVIPGHPLYALVRAYSIFEEALRPSFGAKADDVGRALIARLSQNDPPILLCTEDEMRE